MSDYVFDALHDLRNAIASNTENNPLFNPNWKLVAHCPGNNDEEGWVWVVLDEQSNGWYVFVGWCDYTGWDCQSYLKSETLPADGDFFFEDKGEHILTNEALFENYFVKIARFIESNFDATKGKDYKSLIKDYKTSPSVILQCETLVETTGEGIKRNVRLREKDYAVFILKQILTEKSWQEITTDPNLVKLIEDLPTKYDTDVEDED